MFRRMKVYFSPVDRFRQRRQREQRDRTLLLPSALPLLGPGQGRGWCWPVEPARQAGQGRAGCSGEKREPEKDKHFGVQGGLCWWQLEAQRKPFSHVGSSRGTGQFKVGGGAFEDKVESCYVGAFSSKHEVGPAHSGAAICGC